VHAHTHTHNSSILSVQKVPEPQLHYDDDDDSTTHDQDLDSLHGPKDHVSAGSHEGTPHEEPTDLCFWKPIFICLEVGTHGGTPHGVPRKLSYVSTSRSILYVSSRGPKEEFNRNETQDVLKEKPSENENELKDSALKCKCTEINRTMDDGGLFNKWDRLRRPHDHDDAYADAGPLMDSQGSGHELSTWTHWTRPKVFVIFTGINLFCTLAWLCHMMGVAFPQHGFQWAPDMEPRYTFEMWRTDVTLWTIC